MGNLFLVLLRRPRKGDRKEKRNDPFWEFGRFGITGCHKSNLMNVKRHCIRGGDRLAFAQGGATGFQLVYVAPPVWKVIHRNVMEVNWRPRGVAVSILPRTGASPERRHNRVATSENICRRNKPPNVGRQICQSISCPEATVAMGRRN